MLMICVGEQSKSSQERHKREREMQGLHLLQGAQVIE